MDGFSLLCWICAGAIMLFGAMWTSRRIKTVLRRAEESPAHCPICAYDLTGLTSSICPECGLDSHDSHSAARIRALIRASAPVAASLLLACAAALAPTAVRNGPLSLVPTSALIAAMPWAPGEAAALHEELTGRIRSGDLSSPQGRMLAAACARVIADHSLPERRAGAARVLGASPDRSRATADAIAAALRHPDEAVRLAVIPADASLPRGHPAVRSALAAMVADDSSELSRARAVDALRRCGGLSRTEAAVVTVAAESESPRLRQRAIYAIGAAPPGWKRACRTLARAAVDADESVREAALLILGERARTDAAAIPILADGLGDPSPALRTWTASRLRLLGIRALGALPALFAAITDLDAEVRAAAGEAISSILREIVDPRTAV